MKEWLRLYKWFCCLLMGDDSWQRKKRVDDVRLMPRSVICVLFVSHIYIVNLNLFIVINSNDIICRRYIRTMKEWLRLYKWFCCLLMGDDSWQRKKGVDDVRLMPRSVMCVVHISYISTAVVVVSLLHTITHIISIYFIN